MCERDSDSNSNRLQYEMRNEIEERYSMCVSTLGDSFASSSVATVTWTTRSCTIQRNYHIDPCLYLSIRIRNPTTQPPIRGRPFFWHQYIHGQQNPNRESRSREWILRMGPRVWVWFWLTVMCLSFNLYLLPSPLVKNDQDPETEMYIHSRLLAACIFTIYHF